MRVKISTNPPLPPVRAWFPLAQHSTHGQTISTFKSLLCASLPAFRGISPALLRLSIDGFELLDESELSVVRDGDLISIDGRDVPFEDASARPLFGQEQAVQSASHAPRPQASPSLDERDVPQQAALRSGAVRTKLAAPSRKRKRSPSTPLSGSESDTESSSSESETSSDSESGSELDVSSVSSAGKAEAPRILAKKHAQVTPVQAKLQPSTFVPPGYGKPQTRARNLRRRVRRMHGREATGGSSGGPVSGANAVVPNEDAPVQAECAPTLMSLSLRNKNKAKNFKSLMNRPLPPKIIFGDGQGVSTVESAKTQTQAIPGLIPPSMRSSLPPNLIVTSVDVEAGLHAAKNKRGDKHDYGAEEEVDVDGLEAMADERWATLAKLTREKGVEAGALVGYKALGIDAGTHTPGQVVTVVRVEGCDERGLVVRPLRAVSFSWADSENAEPEEHPWEEIHGGDWRLLA